MRRKIWYTTLCMLLVFLFVGTALSEINFNVDDYTEDELIDIVHMIYESKSQLGYLYASDVLVAGQDIPAGIYECWVEEEDIGFSQHLIDSGLDYHCGSTTLCSIRWGKEYDKYNFDGYVDIFYDEYNTHKMITLEEGQSLWTTEIYGANYVGLRMKYVPGRKSGLFSD